MSFDTNIAIKDVPSYTQIGYSGTAYISLLDNMTATKLQEVHQTHSPEIKQQLSIFLSKFYRKKAHSVILVVK